MKKNTKNYLNFVPIKNPDITWSKDASGMIVLQVTRKGFFDKIAQKFFKVPSKSDIKLDKHGSFIWNCIDDNKSVYHIAQDVKSHFGKSAEPLYDRLVAFINILDDNKFITLKKEGA